MPSSFAAALLLTWLAISAPARAGVHSASTQSSLGSVAELQAETERLRAGGFDEAEVSLLADAVRPTLESADAPTRLSLLREIAAICWEAPPKATQSLRQSSLRLLVEMAGESRRARIMLTCMFLPPLHRLANDEQGAFVADFTEFLRVQLSTADSAEQRADLIYLMAVLRLQVHRAWDAPWLDATERAFAERSYQMLIEDYGSVSAPAGGSYAELALGERQELRTLLFGEKLALAGLQDLDGQSLTLDSLAGKTTVLSFWATWCIPCLQLVPDEIEMVQRLAAEPFEFVGICADPQAAQARKTAARYKMPWRNVTDPLGPDALAQKLLIRQWPSALVLDGEGRLRAKFVGSVFQPPYDTVQLEAAVRDALRYARQE